MGVMRLPRLSLATKYRILFGLAVVLIIGAALAVPWYWMELLVLGPAYHVAQRVVEDHFRYVMHDLRTGRPADLDLRQTDFNLVIDRVSHQARFVPFGVPPEEAATPAPAGEEDLLARQFAGRALRTFVRNPNQQAVYATHPTPAGRQLYYAHAVRVSKRCLSCHAEAAQRARPYQENELAGVITTTLPARLGAEGIAWNRLVIVAAGVLAGTLAILVFYLIVHRFILAPIQELRAVTLRVADGDLAVRASVQTGDEFEQLSANLNAMLERLRAAQEELHRANRLLDEKLEHMAETNVALYEANRVKSEFLANVSHELRTPLTSIIGFAELLRESPQADAPGRAARYAENILISGRILLEIINDLLDLAKIEAGRLELRVQRFDPAELCQTMVDFTRPQAEQNGLRLELDLDGDLPPMETDRGKLRQILFNFLSNAIKFTPPGGEVRLAAQRIGEVHVRLAVRDTGPGIAPEHHQAIFEKFHQIDGSATREHHGTGLGLAIAKELTHLLGGEIGVDSQLGHGATFWVTFCTAAPPRSDKSRVPLPAGRSEPA